MLSSCVGFKLLKLRSSHHRCQLKIKSRFAAGHFFIRYGFFFVINYAQLSNTVKRLRFHKELRNVSRMIQFRASPELCHLSDEYREWVSRYRSNLLFFFLLYFSANISDSKLTVMAGFDRLGLCM